MSGKHARPHPDSQAPPCPRCGYHDGRARPAVREGTVTYQGLEWGIVDIGWGCRKCGHEWGLEVLDDRRFWPPPAPPDMQ